MSVQLSTFQDFPGVNKAKNNTFFNNINGDISAVKKNARIKRRFLALLYAKGVLKINSCIDIAVLVQNKYRDLKYIKSEVIGFQSKAYQAVSRMWRQQH